MPNDSILLVFNDVAFGHCQIFGTIEMLRANCTAETRLAKHIPTSSSARMHRKQRCHDFLGERSAMQY